MFTLVLVHGIITSYPLGNARSNVPHAAWLLGPDYRHRYYKGNAFVVWGRPVESR